MLCYKLCYIELCIHMNFTLIITNKMINNTIEVVILFLSYETSPLCMFSNVVTIFLIVVLIIKQNSLNIIYDITYLAS